MKKIVKYLVAAIAMVAAVSCQKELVEEKAPVKDGDSYVFTASLKPATKTVLNIDKETGVMKSQWWAGAKGKEYINVMDDREVNNKYASANLQEAADKTDFSLDEGADFYGTEVFAVYPYHANNAYWKGEEGEIGVVADFKQIQTATSGNYDPTAPVHVAYNPDITASTNLVFSNLSALVKFDVTTDFVRTITLSGLNGEMVSGPMVYKYANGKYTLEDNTDGYVEVTLTAAPYYYANGNGNAEKNYFAKGAHYLAIVPGTFEKGIQITLNAGLENPITFTHNDPITLRPGTVNDFGAFGTDKNLDWGVAKVGEEEKAQKLEYKDGYFVGIVTLTEDESYKIVASQEDYDASNYGLSFPREYAPVGKYDLATGEAGYEIRVDKTDEYYVMFSTGRSVLYLLDNGAAADEDLDLSKVGTPDPVRTITGGFVDMDEVNDGKTEMTLVTDKDGNALYYETVIEFAENATNFTFQILDGIKDQTNPGQFVKYGWEKPEDYDFAEDYDDTITFGTKVGSPAIDAIGVAGLYYIKQSLDGSTITITTAETPVGKQIYLEELGLIFDLGAFKEDMLYIAMLDEEDPTTAWVYEDNLMAYPFELKYTGPKTGVITYNASMTLKPEYADIAYVIDDSSIILNCSTLELVDSKAYLLSEDEAVSIKLWAPQLPDAQINGQQWRGTFDSTQYLIDLGYTYEGKLTFAELYEPEEGDSYWRTIYVGDYEFESEDASLAWINFGEEDYFVFEMPDELTAGIVYNVCNSRWIDEETLEEALVMFTNVTDEVPEFFTPDGNQWILPKGSELATMLLEETGLEDATCRILFDLGTTDLSMYGPNFAGSNLLIGSFYEDLYGPDAEGFIVAPQSLMITNYQLIPVDSSSGSLAMVIKDEMGEIISTQNLVSYSDYDGVSCTFDLTNMLGISDLKTELSKESYTVQVQ